MKSVVLRPLNEVAVLHFFRLNRRAAAKFLAELLLGESHCSGAGGKEVLDALDLDAVGKVRLNLFRGPAELLGGENGLVFRQLIKGALALHLRFRELPLLILDFADHLVEAGFVAAHFPLSCCCGGERRMRRKSVDLD